MISVALLAARAPLPEGFGYLVLGAGFGGAAVGACVVLILWQLNR